MQRQWALPARAVSPQNLHITLAFLGAMPVARLDVLLALGESLSPPCAELRLDRTGWFPQARVAWLGAGDPPQPLRAFRSDLAKRLSVAGFRGEGIPWNPHVTLYRDLRNRPGTLNFVPVEWAVRGFALLQSRPMTGGVEYHALGSW